MAEYQAEINAVRERIIRIERELEEEIQAINSDTSLRIVEAVRKAERMLAPLRAFIHMTAGASVSNGENAGGEDDRQQSTKTRRSIASSRAKPSKPKLSVSNEKPKSARRLILELIDASESPVPFPVLDRKVMDEGMTRSAGEKSRRTMERSGLVEREGMALKLTDAGRRALADFEAADKQ